MAWYNPTDPNQRNWMIAGLVVLLLLVPFSMYWRTPKIAEHDVLRDRLETLDVQNRQAQVIIARGGADELRRRRDQYTRHVDRLEELIPGEEEIATLLNDIQAVARQSDVDPLSLVPEPPQQAGPYQRTGYQMTVVGEYHDVARFLTEIASLPRIVTPVQMDLTLFGNPQSRPQMEFPVQASFRIETYVLPAQAALPTQMPGEGS